MSVNFDDLFDAAMAQAAEDNLQQLYNALSSLENPAEYGELLGMLFESWAAEDNDTFTDWQGNFILRTLELRFGDNAIFRKALNRAVKNLLPPYLNKQGLLRTIGVNDSNVSIHEAVRRFRNLLIINTNILVFLRGAKRWGIVRNIDAMAGTVGFVPLGLGSSNSLPISTLLSDGVMFQLSPETQRLAAPGNRILSNGNEFKTIANARALCQLSEDELREIASLTIVPVIMNEDDFEIWWNKGAVTVAVTGAKVREACDARSMQEMSVLLESEKQGVKITASQVERFKDFFERLRPASIEGDGKQLAAVVAQLSEKLNDEQLGFVLAPLSDKCGFLPQNPDNATLNDLTIYGEINAKTLTKLFAAFKLFMSEEYLAQLSVKLPQKALNAISENIDDEPLFNAMRNTPPSADVFMFIWKNRAKRTSELLELINIANVVKVINQARLPKEWMAAVRELKNTLMDKAEFQDFLLQSAGHDVKRITGALQGALTLGSGERQSLLVKFARLSQDLQKHLESGAGHKLIQDAKSTEIETTQTVEPMYSSVASIRRLKEELDNIINVEQPKNRESLKTARAHGDFRENSEFDAAKERRNFLSRRRNELERILMQVQAINFSSIKLDKFALIGSTVTLQYQNGDTESHYLLGAWDGNPDKRHLSYKTKLGEAIYHHEVGTTLDLPGGKRAVLAKVEPLPPEIATEMDN